MNMRLLNKVNYHPDHTFPSFRTSNAMEGKVSFEESLERQLKEVGLTRGILKAFLDHYSVKITPGTE